MLHLPFPVRDANATSGAESLGDLPEWDLSDLYPSVEAEELSRDIDWLEKACADFAGDYEGKLADLGASEADRAPFGDLDNNSAHHGADNSALRKTPPVTRVTLSTSDSASIWPSPGVDLAYQSYLPVGRSYTTPGFRRIKTYRSSQDQTSNGQPRTQPGRGEDHEHHE